MEKEEQDEPSNILSKQLDKLDELFPPEKEEQDEPSHKEIYPELYEAIKKKTFNQYRTKLLIENSIIKLITSLKILCDFNRIKSLLSEYNQKTKTFTITIRLMDNN